MKFDIEDIMKFDIKNIKSWSNRKDVKIGDKGYFFNKISNLHDLKENEYSKIESINDNQANCFFSTAFYGGYSFFLPLDAVKEDKSEKKYRPFNDAYELYEFIGVILTITRKEFRNRMLLGLPVTYREKKLSQCATTTLISRIDFDSNDDPRFCYINNRDFKDWFDNYEIMNADGEWQPFGVEVKENED